jgi:hypothetical protein
MDLRVGSSPSAEYFQAKDGRTVALLVRGDFKDYADFPPHVDTKEERDYLAKGYTLEVEKERNTKALFVPHEAPIQILLLNRAQGSVVKPHWHPLDRHPEGAPAKQQMLVCQRGSVRVSVYTKEGEHLGDRVLRERDFILICEGHGFEFLEPDTQCIEIRMGPHSGIAQETRPLY